MGSSTNLKNLDLKDTDFMTKTSLNTDAVFTEASGWQVTFIKKRRYFTSVTGKKKLATFNRYLFFPVTVLSQLLVTAI